MIELISIVCSLVVCIGLPIEVSRIRRGYAPKAYAGDQGKYLIAFRKQLNMLTWVGLGLGVITFGLAFIEKTPGEKVFKIVAGLIWLAVAVICLVSQRMLPAAPAAVPDSTPAPPPS